MKIRKGRIHGWEGYRLEEGDLSAAVIPDLGGRIISLCFRGEELLFVQPEHAGETFDLSKVGDWGAEKRRLGFRVWGGDKTWISPERLWLDKIPPLDIDAGRYHFAVEGKSVVMTSPLCRETGLKVTRSVELASENRLFLQEVITNESPAPVRRGIWNVTQLLKPMDIYLPIRASLLRLYEDAAYQDCKVENVIFAHGNESCVRCCGGTHWKLGGMVDRGGVLCLREGRGGVLALAKSFALPQGAEYAHGSSVEIYNSPIYPYCEVEIHSALARLSPGESSSFEQTWTVSAWPRETERKDFLALLQRFVG